MAGPAPDLLAGLEALDRLDDLTHRARQVPLTDQVRVDPEAFRAELATIRAATAPVLEHEAGAAEQPLTRSVDALQRIVDEAPALPIGRKVRVDQAAVYEALDAFRAALPDAIRRQRGITTGEPAIPAPWAAELRPGIEAVDRLDDLVHHARTVPLTGQVRLDPADHRAAIDAIRHGTAPLLQDEARVSRRPLTEAIDALQRMLDDAPTLPLGSDVRVSREAVLDALDELRARLSEAARRRGGGPDAV